MTVQVAAVSATVENEGSGGIDNSDNLDIAARVKLLEQELAGSLAQLRRRIEALESKAERQKFPDPKTELQETADVFSVWNEPFAISPSCQSRANREASKDTITMSRRVSHARTSHMGELAMAVKERNVSSFAERFDLFIVDNLPFNREHSHLMHPVHKFLRIGVFTYISFCMMLFVLWGLFKLVTPMTSSDGFISNFVEIQHELKSSDEDLRMPELLCIADLAEGLNVEAFHTTIPSGNQASRTSFRLELVSRDVATGTGTWQKKMKCLTQDVSIIGSFGDVSYKYISFNIFSDANATIDYPTASFVMMSRIGLTNKITSPIFKSFDPDTWTGVEILLDRVQTMEGDLVGISRMAPAKYKDFWAETDVAVSDFYSRFGKRWIRNESLSSQRIYATYYIRSSGLERDDSYQRYDMMTILMDSGGLWIAMSISASSGALFLSLVFNFCARVCLGKAGEEFSLYPHSSNDPIDDDVDEEVSRPKQVKHIPECRSTTSNFVGLSTDGNQMDPIIEL